MIPILYRAAETDFGHCGLGVLSEVTSCTVTEERNGAFECEFKYPVDGRLYSQIHEDCLVKVQPNETAEPQLFRIYRSAKPLNGIVTYYAEHISYTLKGIPLERFSIENTTAQDAMQAMFRAALLPCEFTAESDITEKGSTALELQSVRSALGGAEGSVLDVWGGEFEFDNFTVRLHRSRGRNTGIKIAYGKNLTDFSQERNISEVYTGVFPYAKYTDVNEEKQIFSLPEKILYSPRADRIARSNICIKDFSDTLGTDQAFTEEGLRALANEWMQTSGFDIPAVSMTVSFVNLWQSPEYAEFALLERVGLCDTVTVEFPKLGVSTAAKVVKTKYDVLNEKYLSITLGSTKANFADTVNQTSSAISQTKAEIQKTSAVLTVDIKKAVEEATQAITGHTGGYVVLNPPRNPQEVLIMDAPTLEDAKKIWRWNSGGLGYSKNGYNGPFETAITQNGEIAADFITVGKVSARNIDVDGVINAGKIATSEEVLIEAERATGAEEQLSGRIKTATESIETEVFRAKGEEEKLLSRIEQNAKEITAKVSQNGGTEESFSWSLTSSGFYLRSKADTVLEATGDGLSVAGKITATSGSIGGWEIGSDTLFSEQVGLHSGNTYQALSILSYENQTSDVMSSIKFYAGSTVASYQLDHRLELTAPHYALALIQVPQTGGRVQKIRSCYFYRGTTSNSIDETMIQYQVVTKFSNSVIRLEVQFSPDLFPNFTPSNLYARVEYDYEHGADGSKVQILNDGSAYMNALCVSENPLEPISSGTNVLIRNGKIRVDPGYINTGNGQMSCPVIYFRAGNDQLFALCVNGYSNDSLQFVCTGVSVTEITAGTDIT